MIELTDRHKGPYLATVVENLLTTYGISLKQIHTATTDGAKNMANTVRHMTLNANVEGERNEHQSHSGSDAESDEAIYSDGAMTNESDDDRMELENEIELNNELNNDERYVELVTEMTGNLRDRNNLLSLINHVKCCTHATQLPVNKALDGSEAKEVVLDVRDMVKALRTEIINIEFRKLAPGCILPRAYVETRWNSDYLMVSSSHRLLSVPFYLHFIYMH